MIAKPPFTIQEVIRVNSLEFSFSTFAEMFDTLKKAVFCNRLTRGKKYMLIIKEIR